MINAAILSYYDKAPEETRLDFGPGQLERMRTRELILRHVPHPPAVVLDVGAGAGAYSFWLADRGYEVHLIDAVPRLVQVAAEQNASAIHRVQSLAVGDARSLEMPSQRADVILLLGPLYHLPELEDRRRALREAFRVLRPGGVLIAAAISRFASALDGLAREVLVDPAFARIVQSDLADGRHENETDRLDYFTTAYFHQPEDLRTEVSREGFDVVALYGIEGPAWILIDLEARLADPARRDIVLQVARALESEPSVLGCSAHLAIVGQKPKES